MTAVMLLNVALQLSPLVFVRPGELRHLEWSEVDFENALWSIPAEKMKMREPHLVPLSKQAIKILDGTKKTDRCKSICISSGRTYDRPMSK